ncbi:DegT/DnrJ/EryC1/StrS aminotransferase family protein [bacterium]|nr:DegT/DnrJ/EryC1/StrS aminotransferase family protein [bacterium]
MNNPQENIERFEEIVAEFVHAKYAIATDSCTNAIFLCLKYYEQRYGLNDRPAIKVPKQTYLSVPQAVMHAGWDVEFVDDSWVGEYRLDPYPIYDSATRFEEEMYSRSVQLNNLDLLQCISFHVKKPLPIGRGGMILTDDKDAMEWLKQARYDGRKGDMFNDINDIEVLGYHMYMTPEQAARGIELFYGIDVTRGKSYSNYPDVSKYSCFQSK